MNNNYPLHIEKQQEQIYAESIGKLSRAINKKVKDEYDNLDSAKFGEIENQLYEELGKKFLTYEYLSLQFENIGKLLDAWTYARVKWYIQKAMMQNKRKFYSIVFEKDDPMIQDFMQSYVKKNIELVQALGKKYIPQISQLASKTFIEGGSTKDLAYQMLKFTNDEKNKARFYGRDQLGDCYSEFTKVRQTSVGVTEYIWATMKDNAVREAHQELEGRIFNWQTGASETGLLSKPGAKHPGMDWSCRCQALPIIE
jgi:SPP1 gp7 family putative phage head morphogenesis protein